MVSDTRVNIAADWVGFVDQLMAEIAPRDAELRGRLSKTPDAGADQLKALLRSSLLSDHELARRLGAATGTPVIQNLGASMHAASASALSPSFMHARLVVPFKEDGESLHVAVANPFDADAVRALAFFQHKNILVHVAPVGEIERAIDAYAESDEERAAALSEVDATDTDRLRSLADEAPVVRAVGMLLSQATEDGASDIHLEPEGTRSRVRMRIDGQLYDRPSPSGVSHAALVSRLKILASLDIAERRLPQDGRIRQSVQGRAIDIRMSTSPMQDGESVVLRLLDQGALELDFAALGFDGGVADRLKRLLAEPDGIILVTGPTGSGKTTTLYAALSLINDPGRKILTVEDPIEYRLPGINQTQVKPEIGHSFAHALRSFLRQDPDIMMVGEIRDLETARVSVQAALTGHLVLSTLHTNDAVSTIARLIDMGAEDYLLCSTIRGIVAQRLVRKLCASCREPYEASPGLLSRFGLNEADSATLYHAVGCGACRGAGYKGRTVIAEVLVFNDALRSLILNRCPAADLRRQAIADGMVPMATHGALKALAGVTSVEEVARATREV